MSESGRPRTSDRGAVTADLLELAARCEREEPSRELDAEIAVALGHHIEWRTANYVMTRFPAISWQAPHPYAGMREPCPSWTSSLDSAVTLVPEGLAWMAAFSPKEGGRSSVRRDFVPTVGKPMARASGRTATLALCAAALRARASLMQGEE